MSAPTPSLLKKLHDEKRASESTPPVETTSARSQTNRSERPLSSKSGSKKSSTGKAPTPPETSANTDRGPQKTSGVKTKSAGQAKKPSEGTRPEHLTDRPLRNHQGLLALREQMVEVAPKSTRKQRRAQRR